MAPGLPLWTNLLSPISDLNEILHCNIKGLLLREMMRIENNSSSILLDASTNSPHYFCKKCKGARKENL